MQVRLLYKNTDLAVGVNLVAAAALGWLQWEAISHPVVLGWVVYMVLVSVARFVLKGRYFRSPVEAGDAGWWGTAFAVGAGLTGVGWGTAGILLYPASQLWNQVFLAFILGGMMLGAASVLAPRAEAALAFLLPTGLAPAVRLLIQDDEVHVAMGLLATVFTVAIVITTRRIHMTIDSSLNLQFENEDLVEDLKVAKERAEALNEHLEVRVQERTAELQRSTEQLRSEIQQREQVEEELLRTRKLESLGVLAGGIAHDLNNFLAVVQGNVEVGKSLLDPADPAQGTMDEIAMACDRAVFLSSQLLTFAKGGAPVRRLVSLSKVIRESVQLARSGAQVSIEVSIAEDLHCAEVDRSQIGQVLHNLLLNARQAMPAGGIIEVRAENADLQSGDGVQYRVRISVRDYGSGIAPEVLPRIFDPYFTTKQGANGLGLATAYAIVAKHGGSLSVESKEGQGAVFTLELPASTGIPEAETRAVSPVQRGTERLLVMDDEAALRKLLRNILGKLGYEVHTARDGAEAVALYEEAQASGNRFDAVLLDLTVSGGMGGIEAAAKLKEIDPAAKLIVSSGYSDSPVLSDFRTYGFEAVISKPWTVAEMSSVFRRVLVADPHRQRPICD